MSNLLVIVSGIGSIQSILFALLILLKKKKHTHDWILFIWFLVFFIHLLIGIYREGNQTNIREILIWTIGFLHGPFFLMYAKVTFNIRLNRTDLLHFLPFLVFAFFSAYVPLHSETLWEIIILIAKLISLTFYPLYILYLFYQKLVFLKENCENNSVLELSWIKIIAFLFLISTGVSIMRLIIELSVGVSYFEFLDVLRYVILVTVIGFYGLKYGVVYKPELFNDFISDEKKYKHSPLNTSQIIKLRNVIDLFFQENEAHLNSDFSLADLSKSLNIPKHHLSQIINSEMNTTFYNLINTKRVEYAKGKLTAGNMSNLTLEGLGYESGFNSKSAFFHHFKKITGKTPGQFEKEIGTD